MDKIPKIETAPYGDLLLDPYNPRLGRHNTAKGLSQDDVLDLMKDWSLEELAVSFLESGFWPQEALIAIEEKVYKKNALVVVEGNRRLAAIKMLHKAHEGNGAPPKWKELVRPYSAPAFARLKEIPYILKPDRKSVTSYLGFRHVTGIKEWDPAEKAQFIAHLIEEEGLDYDQVRSRIGSKAPTVRQNYISYRLLLQMEGSEDVDVAKVEDRFSVLFLSLRTQGVQQYLHVDILADKESARTPVPKKYVRQLSNFARWLFGKGDKDGIVQDSRQVDDFGKILESEAAVEYLERNESPSFAVARRMAGVSESEVSEHVERAADEIEEALKAAHLHKSSARLQAAVKRAGADALQLLDIFPVVHQRILKERG